MSNPAFPASELLEQPDRSPGRIRRLADRFIHHPRVELALIALIVLSVALLLAETTFIDDGRLRILLEQLGDAITWVFLAELLIRFWVAPKKRRFFRRYWIDILAILPLVRALRLFRVVRLLRLFRAGMLLNRRMAVFQGTFRGARAEFTVLGTLTAVLVLAAAVTIHLGEKGLNPDFSGFEGSVWFSVFSLIGGEPIGGAPTTEIGRVVTLVLMLGGMTVFGMFVGTVSASMVSRLSGRMEVNEMDLDELHDHILVCGWNPTGPTIIRETFEERGSARPVVVINEAEGLPQDLDVGGLPRELLYHVSGDYTRIETLEKAAVRKAGIAILLSDETVARSPQDRDARTVLAALTIERLAHGIFTCAQLEDRQNESLLRMSGVEEIVVPDEYSGYILGSVGRNRGLVKVLDEILSTRYGNAFHKATVPPRYDGVRVAELHGILKATYGAILISVERSGEPPQVNPPADRLIQAGDQLVVVSTAPVSW